MAAAPGRPARNPRIDAVVAIWALLWVVLGVWTAVEVWRLSDITVTVVDSGHALDSAGEALQELESVPVVGDRAAELGTEVRQNAGNVVADADRARDSFRRLAVLLGVAVALVPSVPVVLLRVAIRRAPLPGG